MLHVTSILAKVLLLLAGPLLSRVAPALRAVADESEKATSNFILWPSFGLSQLFLVFGSLKVEAMIICGLVQEPCLDLRLTRAPFFTRMPVPLKQSGPDVELGNFSLDRAWIATADNCYWQHFLQWASAQAPWLSPWGVGMWFRYGHQSNDWGTGYHFMELREKWGLRLRSSDTQTKTEVLAWSASSCYVPLRSWTHRFLLSRNRVSFQRLGWGLFCRWGTRCPLGSEEACGMWVRASPHSEPLFWAHLFHETSPDEL